MLRFVIVLFLFGLASFDVQAVSSAGNEESQNVEAPDPLSLQKGWWEYFSVGQNELKARIEQANKALDLLKESLNEQEHPELLDLVDRVQLQMEVYLQKTKELVEKLPTNLQFRKGYTIGQLLEINAKIHAYSSEMAVIGNKQATVLTTISRLQSKIDQLQLLYYSLQSASHDKLKAGLRMMEFKFKLEVQNVRKVLLKEQMEYAESEWQKLKDEFKIAKESLTFEEVTGEQLQAAVQQARKAYEAQRRRALELEKKAITKEKEFQGDGLICCLWELKTLAESIQTERLDLKILLQSIKKQFYSLVMDPDQIDSGTVQDHISLWKREIGDAKSLRQEWEIRIDQQLEKISKIVAKLSVEEGDQYKDLERAVADIHIELDRSYALNEDLQVEILQAEMLMSLVEERLIKEKTLWETWTIVAKNYYTGLRESIHNLSSYALFRLKDTPVTLGNFLNALVIIVIAILFSRFFRKAIARKKFFKIELSGATEYILNRAVHIATMLLGVLVALSYLGLDFTNLAIIAGALGVGIGFGLQTMVNNILSGFLLLFQRLIKVGDLIEVDQGMLGKVVAINLQNTLIRSLDGAELLIPNSDMTKGMLTNWTLSDSYRRFQVPFGVAYGSDKEKVRQVAIEAAKKLSCVVTDNPRYPDPQVWMVGMGDSSLDFKLVAWVNLNIPVPGGTPVSAMLWELESALKDQGIEVPFPQQDIYIKEFPERKPTMPAADRGGKENGPDFPAR